MINYIKLVLIFNLLKKIELYSLRITRTTVYETYNNNQAVSIQLNYVY